MFIYIVTNRKLIKEGNIYDKAEETLKYGSKAIILREKDLSYTSLYEMAARMKSITDKYNARLIVNGNLRVAEEVNSYAYHMSFDNFNTGKVSNKIKNGVSVHSLKEAVQVEKGGADYLICGNVYKTPCKPDLDGRGLDYIRNIVKNVSIPVIAIGGIAPSNINDIINTGAEGAAIMTSAMRDPLIVKSFIESLG